MSTTNNKKELLAIHNTQQRGIITCLKQTTHRELLPVYSKQQVKELIPVYNKQQRGISVCVDR
jgi:hypothetical protein